MLRRDGSVVRIDPRTGDLSPVGNIDWSDRSDRTAVADEVAIWIDDAEGATAVALTARSTHVIRKEDQSAPEFSAEGIPTPSPSATASVTAPPLPNGSFVQGPGKPPEPDDNGVDDPPIALDDQATSAQGRSITIPVTANDYDPDGGPVLVSSVGKAAHGTARILSASSVVYVPQPGESRDDSFSYTIVDSGGQSDAATVNVHLLGTEDENLPPVAGADEATTAAGRPVSVDVLANDVDPESGPLVVGQISPPPPEQGRGGDRGDRGRPS